MTKTDDYIHDNQLNTSEPKRKILYYQKIAGEAGLSDLAKMMNISRMGVHKHLADLQDRGLVENMQVRKGVGRPTMVYFLASKSKNIFPKAYGELATYALDYVAKNLGKEALEDVLRARQKELYDKYNEKLKNLQFNQKVKELARLRDEEGYIAESKRERSSDSHILLEYNCPIILVAEKHWEACAIETELFENVLGANVQTTHRAAKGDPVCKFHIKRKLEGL